MSVQPVPAASATSSATDAWLEAFAAAVQGRDLIAGRALFAAHVVGFGTRTPAAHSLEDLVRNQWAPVWGATAGFSFGAPDLVRGTLPGAIAVAVRWSSEASGGRLRSGRATLILEQSADGSLVCTHSHFSLDPDDGGRL